MSSTTSASHAGGRWSGRPVAALSQDAPCCARFHPDRSSSVGNVLDRARIDLKAERSAREQTQPDDLRGFPQPTASALALEH